jgi:hypothetical protein
VNATLVSLRRQQVTERYIGVDVADDGELVIAERQDGRRAGSRHFPAGSAGVSALREHIAAQRSRPHVCVRACGAAALAVATGLLTVPQVEVTLISPRTIEWRRPGADAAPMNADERAEHLARRAERLF